MQKTWTENQKLRAKILFELYPEIYEAYSLNQKLNRIFQQKDDKIYSYTRLVQWHEKVAKSGFKSFNTISRTIMNYFDNRSTNASAESSNAKIKAIRAQFRGVRNIEYVFFRLTKIYA